MAQNHREEATMMQNAVQFVEHSMGEVRVKPWQEAALRFQRACAGFALLPSWYVVPDDVAPHFVVEDILIGRSSQHCWGDGVPASLFAESARSRFPGVSLAHDLLCEGEHLEVRVTNITDVERRFRCSVVGNLVKPGQSCAGGSHLVVGLETRATRTRVGLYAVVSKMMRLGMTLTHLYVPYGVLDEYRVDELSVLSGGIYSRVPSAMLTDKSLRAGAEISLLPDQAARAGSLLTLWARQVAGSPSYFRGALLGTLGDAS